ncbi:MAG: 2-(1,2-epoxy-1,2-dihydrophenyl)acetyl-CoA isomerase PaaG [Pseudomonadota bacterium]
MSDSVLTEHHDTWVEITLNRPDRLNSFNEDMHNALRLALEEAGRTARAVLLTGAGRGFCAGQDLGDRDPAKMDGPPDLSRTLRMFYAPLVRQIRALPMPVVCAVNGVAAGAGANVALACDLVVAAESARFIQSFAKVGLVPDSGGTWSLTRRLGEARAKGLALTAHPLSATQAEAWGLIWRAVPDADLMAEARRLAADLSRGPTHGFARTKAAIHEAAVNDFDTQLEREADHQRACGLSPDYAEGVSAFLEKRAPAFTGEPSHDT